MPLKTFSVQIGKPLVVKAPRDAIVRNVLSGDFQLQFELVWTRFDGEPVERTFLAAVTPCHVHADEGNKLVQHFYEYSHGVGSRCLLEEVSR